MRYHASTSRSCRLQIRPDAHTDIANLKSSLRLIISGSPHNRSTDMRQGGKKGGLQNKPAQPLCTVCGKFSHDSKACPAKGSPYTNLTPSAFVGSAGHTKLVNDKGPRNYIPGAPPVVLNKTKAAETLSEVNAYSRQWMALINLLLSSVSHLTSPNYVGQ